ncbi:MAG: hypothetical protein AB4063_16895 [Crocosphaera sp.]
MNSIESTTQTHDTNNITNLYETDFLEWTIKQAQALNDHNLTSSPPSVSRLGR